MLEWSKVSSSYEAADSDFAMGLLLAPAAAKDWLPPMPTDCDCCICGTDAAGERRDAGEALFCELRAAGVEIGGCLLATSADTLLLLLERAESDNTGPCCLLPTGEAALLRERADIVTGGGCLLASAVWCERPEFLGGNFLAETSSSWSEASSGTSSAASSGCCAAPPLLPLGGHGEGLITTSSSSDGTMGASCSCSSSSANGSSSVWHSSAASGSGSGGGARALALFVLGGWWEFER